MVDHQNPLDVGNCPRNLQLFRAAVSAIFQDVRGSVSQEEFAEKLTILKKKPKSSQRLYEKMFDTIYDNLNTRLDEFITEDELTEKFETLERLTEESQALPDHVAWRPPGDVEEHLRAIDGVKIRQQVKKLEEYVANIEADNKKLLQQVKKGRATANRVESNADRLLNQQKHVRSQFEKTAKQLENDIKKINR